MEEGGGTAFPVGSRVMFTGPYGVSENGAYSEWLAVRKENLCLIPDNIEDVSAAGVPVAYLTAQMALSSCWICKWQDGAVTCDRRFGRKRSHSDWRGRKGRNTRYQPRPIMRRRNKHALWVSMK